MFLKAFGNYRKIRGKKKESLTALPGIQRECRGCQEEKVIVYTQINEKNQGETD